MGDSVDIRLGDYRLVERIGAGGMGEVYRARHEHMGKTYAVKVLPPELAADSDFAARFRDEARVMAELDHEGIVQVHYMGREDGKHFLVMDYVTAASGEPETLGEYLNRQQLKRISEGEVRQWAVEIAEALAYAHRRGVVHRDIKPGNLLLDAHGRLKLTDFGLAKAIGSEFILSQIHQSMKTLSGGRTQHASPPVDTLDVKETRSADAPPSGGSDRSGILGTYDYMAPEQRGEGTGQIDQRTDLYALGKLIYRMLTGKRATAFAKPPSQAVVGLSKRWDGVVRHCVADDPEDRYPSAELLLEDLRRALPRGATRAIRAGVLGVALAAVVCLGGHQAVRWWQGRQGTRQDQHARLAEQRRLAELAQQKRSEIARLLVSARADLAANRYTTAGQTLQRLLELDPANAGALALRQEVARRAGLAEAAPVKAAAELKWQRLQARTLDRTQGIGELLDGLEVLMGTAATLFGEKDYGQAMVKYQAAAAECDRLTKLDADRAAARKAKAACEAALAGALSAGAKADAPGLLATADPTARAAGTTFEAGDFAKAAALWKRAGDEYGRARTAAEKAAAERQARRQRFARHRAEGVRLWESKDPARLAEAIASLEKALAEKDDADTRGLLEDVKAAKTKHDADEAAFAKLIAEARRLSASWPADSSRLTSVQRAGVTAARRAIQAALVYKPADAAALALKAKLDTFVAKELTLELGGGVKMKLVLIPAGKFVMGSPATEKEHDEDERPQREVGITKPFYMGTHEVTQEQYQQVTGETPSRFPGWTNPVEQVSWGDAVKFCKGLSTKTGKTVRLPTEAQWEYACRAGTTTPFHTGATISRDQANYDCNFTYGDGKKSGSWQETSAVGRFKPNAFGLYDMHGNVWEWCSDWYADSYANAKNQDPKGPDSGKYRVLRGGSWFSHPRNCRSASRSRKSRGSRDLFTGFRVLVVVGGVD